MQHEGYAYLGGANSDSVALNNVSSFKDLEVDLGDGTNSLTVNHFSQSDSLAQPSRRKWQERMP